MDKINKLFNLLHSSPELSMNEDKTNQIIFNFLKTNTSLNVYKKEGFVYAVHFEDNNYENVAFRADIDAIKDENGKPFHGCGHDGHTTTLCRLAFLLDNKKLSKNIYFFFQPGEETGEGAILVNRYLQELNISRIYGFHNIPGYKSGLVLLKPGTFACASKGITINFEGKQSHAAYPESGNNPAFAIADVINNFGTLLNKSLYKGLVLATIVNVSVGEKNAFGVNAGNGELSVTIRAEYENELNKIQNNLLDLSSNICEKYGIKMTYNCFDEFPETYNDIHEYNRIKSILLKNQIDYTELESPMRWSEDFGHYLKNTNGIYIGIGSGIDHPDLHTKDFAYNTNIINYSAKVLSLFI